MDVLFPKYIFKSQQTFLCNFNIINIYIQVKKSAIEGENYFPILMRMFMEKQVLLYTSTSK